MISNIQSIIMQLFGIRFKILQCGIKMMFNQHSGPINFRPRSRLLYVIVRILPFKMNVSLILQLELVLDLYHIAILSRFTVCVSARMCKVTRQRYVALMTSLKGYVVLEFSLYLLFRPGYFMQNIVVVQFDNMLLIHPTKHSQASLAPPIAISISLLT